MFKMRNEQKVAFRNQAVLDFEDQMTRHVERCFPERRGALGEGGVREVIRLGIQRAATFGIIAERDVCRFVDLLLVFGVGLDRDCPWAREILEALDPPDPAVRMDLLYERALEEA